jgi:FMN reductase
MTTYLFAPARVAAQAPRPDRGGRLSSGPGVPPRRGDVRTIVMLTGSPNPGSRTDALLSVIGAHLSAAGLPVRRFSVRDLPAEALLHGSRMAPAVLDLADAVAGAYGIVLGTPVYGGAYSGALKLMLDVLPRDAFAGKAVLTVATGGEPAHLLGMDRVWRPVLSAMGATRILPGHHVPEGGVLCHPRPCVTEATAAALPPVVARLADAVRALRPVAVPALH